MVAQRYSFPALAVLSGLILFVAPIISASQLPFDTYATVVNDLSFEVEGGQHEIDVDDMEEEEGRQPAYWYDGLRGGEKRELKERRKEEEGEEEEEAPNTHSGNTGIMDLNEDIEDLDFETMSGFGHDFERNHDSAQSSNATTPGVLDTALIADSLPSNAIGPFRLRMVWSKESCWQGECDHELDWCMQCEGYQCNEGDILWIELCRNIDQQLFVWVPIEDEADFQPEDDEEPEDNFGDDKKRKLQLNLLQHLYDHNLHTASPTRRPSASPTGSPTASPTSSPSNLPTVPETSSPTPIANTTNATTTMTEEEALMQHYQEYLNKTETSSTKAPSVQELEQQYEEVLKGASSSEPLSTKAPSVREFFIQVARNRGTETPSTSAPAVAPSTNAPSVEEMETQAPVATATPTSQPTEYYEVIMEDVMDLLFETTTATGSHAPSGAPSTNSPTENPSNRPTTLPPTSDMPSILPSSVPSELAPTASPSYTPTTEPPSSSPTSSPSPKPSVEVSSHPSTAPITSTPSKSPTSMPSTEEPTSREPTTASPSESPTTTHSLTPTGAPTTTSPSQSPTEAPTTREPTTDPPSKSPTASPSMPPVTSIHTISTLFTFPSAALTGESISKTPTAVSQSPSPSSPSILPTGEPTSRNPTTTYPTMPPTEEPTNSEPTTGAPSKAPSMRPTYEPTTRRPTTTYPTMPPTEEPTTRKPTTAAPSKAPSRPPTREPTRSGASKQLGVFKVADPSKDLCLDRIHLNRYHLLPCDQSRSQLFYGVPHKRQYNEAFELRPRRKYAIDRLDDKCVNMHHHPRNYEEIINTSCELARFYQTSQWQIVLDSEDTFARNRRKNINTFLMGMDETPDDLTGPQNLYTLLAPRQNPRCSIYTQCGICQGHCSSDDECVGNLRCFERSWDNELETPPGCQGDGVARVDYCFAEEGN